MPDTDPHELIQLAIDGHADAEQQVELRTLLASAESQSEYAELSALAKQLDAVPLVDPPGVRPSVMAQIFAATSMKPPERLNAHRSRNLLAFAYAAAAVLAIVFIVQRTIPTAPSSAATMVRIEVSDWPVVAQAANNNGAMTVRGNGDEFAVEVSVNGPYTVEWDASRLRAGATPGRLTRQPGAKGPAVIRLHLQNNEILIAAINLR